MGPQEVIAMPLRVMLTMILLMVCVALLWPRPGGSVRDARVARSSPGAKLTENSRPVSVEGVLVGQLVAGRITRGQYLQAMSDLAQRDAQRHPLEAPRD
jgi:hypothetical protein